MVSGNYFCFLVYYKFWQIENLVSRKVHLLPNINIGIISVISIISIISIVSHGTNSYSTHIKSDNYQLVKKPVFFILSECSQRLVFLLDYLLKLVKVIVVFDIL